MKKIAFIIAIALSLLALFGCETQTKDEHVHAYGEWETVTEASCVLDGLAERACACGEKENKIIGKRLIIRDKTGNPDTSPATKHPKGIVAIPHKIPKNNSL